MAQHNLLPTLLFPLTYSIIIFPLSFRTRIWHNTICYQHCCVHWHISIINFLPSFRSRIWHDTISMERGVERSRLGGRITCSHQRPPDFRRSELHQTMANRALHKTYGGTDQGDEGTRRWIQKGQCRSSGHIDGAVQDCSNSIAYALELLQSCT